MIRSIAALPLLRRFLLGAMPPDQAREHVVEYAERADAEVLRSQQLRETLAPWGDSDAKFSGASA